MKKIIRITASPFNSNLEVAEDNVLKLFAPYSESEVTIQVNPNITDYIENNDQPGINIRQVVESKSNDETQTIKFDLTDNKIKEVSAGDKSYKIELLEIGKEDLEGQSFLFFEFSVEC